MVFICICYGQLCEGDICLPGIPIAIVMATESTVTTFPLSVLSLLLVYLVLHEFSESLDQLFWIICKQGRLLFLNETLPATKLVAFCFSLLVFFVISSDSDSGILLCGRLVTKQVTACHSATLYSWRHTFQQETARVILSRTLPLQTLPARNTSPSCHEQTYLHSSTCLKSDTMNEAILSRFDTLGKEAVIFLRKKIHYSLKKKQDSLLELKDDMLSRNKGT